MAARDRSKPMTHIEWMARLFGNGPTNRNNRETLARREARVTRGPGVKVDERGVPIGMPPMADYDD